MRIIKRDNKHKIKKGVFVDLIFDVCGEDITRQEIPINIDWGLPFIIEIWDYAERGLYNEFSDKLSWLFDVMEDDIDIAEQINSNLTYWHEYTDKEYNAEIQDAYVYDENGNKADFLLNREEIEGMISEMESIALFEIEGNEDIEKDIKNHNFDFMFDDFEYLWLDDDTLKFILFEDDDTLKYKIVNKSYEPNIEYMSTKILPLDVISDLNSNNIKLKELKKYKKEYLGEQEE